MNMKGLIGGIMSRKWKTHLQTVTVSWMDLIACVDQYLLKASTIGYMYLRTVTVSWMDLIACVDQYLLEAHMPLV